MQNKCTRCGQEIDARKAKFMQKYQSSEGLVCLKCINESIRETEIEYPICTKCAEPIDPSQLQIFAISKTKETIPKLCEGCQSKDHPKLPPKRLH
ncbi:MAG: hypothetical protein BAJATHORv1_30031 [Candidatus Thorarchaeota archaeon]|nr:MAG: hypothetical protein BAJATHORv1_30031 [Candidatus Thorarchaeota archaeon]